jgi:hypothetical protein
MTESFPGLSPTLVGDTVRDLHAQFAGCPIRDFVPVLVERMAKSVLALRPVAVIVPALT